MRVLIVTGGSLDDRAARAILKEFSPEWVIAADSGIQYALQLALPIDQILGDFDSVNASALKECEEKGISQMIFPAEKDYTDTELALEEAAKKAGMNGQILLLGATGTRLDHSLANILLLKKTTDQGISCEIADGYNRIQMLKGKVTEYMSRSKEWKYISLLPVFGDAEGVTLTGFKYPLSDAVLKAGYALGVSNELIEETGTITIQQGYLLRIRSKD